MPIKIPGRQRRKKEKIALIVPGQGFQRLGMGNGENGQPIEFLEETIAAARGIIDPIQVDRIRRLLLVDVSALSPEEKKQLEQEIDRTDNAQIALFLLVAAQWQEYRANEDNVMPNVVLGHSAGEPIAGYIAGAYDFEAAAKYIFSRGLLMNICNSLFPGGMALVSLREKELPLKLIEGCLRNTKVEIANFNTPKRLVVSGAREELEWVVAKLREKGLRATLLRGVAGAYHHSKAMAPAKGALDQLFSSSLITIKRPAIRWILNLSGDFEDSEKHLMVALPAQVTNIVKWAQSIESALKFGVTRFIEFGPGEGPTTWLGDFSAWQKIQSLREPGR